MKLVSLEETKSRDCVPVTFPLDPKLIEEMFQIMKDNNGIGLAAPQVGIFQQFFLLNVGNVKRVVCNPVMSVLSQKKEHGIEGCLTCPGEQFEIVRFSSVALEGFDESGIYFKWSAAKGLLGKAVQHEMHHLDGRCIKDFGSPVEEKT